MLGGMITSWIRNRFRPALDPNRAARVYRDYDEKRGYRTYHETCQKAYSPMQHVADVGDELAERGFEHVRAMSDEAATALLKEIRERFPIASLKKNKPELEGFQIDDEYFRDRLLSAALSPMIDLRVMRYFRSRYRVLWYFISQTEIGGGTASFRWHCDKGPSRHLKLLIYLNDEVEHGGNTEFLDLEASRALAETGYLFGPADRRAGDLTQLLKGKDIVYQPISRPMTAGDSILFQPSRTAHRGISPTRSTRYALTLCLLPSLLPWRDALTQGELLDLRSDRKWHTHASELLAAEGST